MANESILVIDDNALNMKLMSIILANAGFNLRVAGSASEALEAITVAVPELILVDIKLPGMDGLTLTRKLRADAANAMRGDEQRAIEAGCDGYITKPIDTRGLPGTVAAYLSRRRRRP